MLVIDKSYIESRVNDWVQRIDDLYLFVKHTLVNVKGVKYELIKKMVMHEELMQEYGVAPTDVPILDLYKEEKLIASFKPIGLWVIGANGRVDILTKVGAFILVNVTEIEGDSKWEVFAPTNRRKGQPFDANFIHELVKLQ